MSLSIHEAAHAWAADRLGDPTARLLGRLTINPVAHIDPIGTLLLPAIGMLTGFPLIGWAKPVPVNLHQLAHPRRDFMLVAAAGPASNVLQALVLAAAFRLLYPGGVAEGTGAVVLLLGVLLNISLALFNLVPVPPLDGGNMLAGLLPERMAQSMDRIRPFGILIVYALLLSGLLSVLVFNPARAITRILLT